jgi:soluble lytic murein transglycosylase-like protein
MPPSNYDYPPSDRMTTASPKGGCLSGFIVPPLAVICIGAMLAFFMLGAGPAVTPDALAAPVKAAAVAAPVQVEAAFSVPTVEPKPAAPGLSPVFRPEVQYWAASIVSWAAAAGLDPNLVATVMQIESCGDPQALSGAGAMGLFQVMPYHFTASDDPYDPATNALRGTDYLRRSMQAANGNARLALAGYNGGIGVIGRSESSWAGQTQRYAYWGSGIYEEASNGSTVSSRLQEWYNASGGGLCREASARLGLNP